jgi:hypothetical protein
MMTRQPYVAFLLPILMACAEEGPASPVPNLEPPAGSVRFGIFEGKVPCSGCERVKMRLTLHRDELDDAPTAYVLERIEVGQGNDRLISRGTWAATAGPPTAPCATVVALDGGPDDFSRYLLLGTNLLLVLDQDLEPRVGNEVHSFTLSRTD